MINCYKCELTPSQSCGECPVWLADAEVSEKERVAYKQIRADAIDECIEEVKLFEFFTNDGTKNVLINNLEQLKEQK